MGLITWKPSLETGHAKIDTQHQALVDAFNALHTAMKLGKGKEELSRTLAFLKSYTVEHFTMEEELMDRFGYPGAPEHKGIHGSLVSQVAELCQRFDAGKTALTLPVMDFLEGWLVEHIQGEDVRLAQFLKAKGNQA
ncbi:MAG: hemerythrin family protein [Holophaga sp.]|nr:hemerythrin family protein [Holophaga sp.]